MGKIVGIVLLMSGIISRLYQWVELQKERQLRIQEFCLFLHKAIFAMETEKFNVITYFTSYKSQDARLNQILREIAGRLRKNCYPNGQEVWEMVFLEQEVELLLDKDGFGLFLKSGMGFFGRSREENISFLKKQLELLETQQKYRKEKDQKERSVWVPVSLLSGVMLTILFL